MDMGEPIVIPLCGIPTTSNPSKVKLQLETKCGVHISKIRVLDHLTEVVLSKLDSEKFIKNFPSFIYFGNKKHDVTISNDFSVEDYSKTEEDTTCTPSPKNGQDYFCLCDAVYNWCDLAILPRERQGILLQKLNPKITPYDIKTYFETVQGLGVITVVSVILMTDGVLVLFDDDEAAKRIWDFRPHRIKQMPTSILLKAVPESRKDRLILETSERPMSKARLEQWLQEDTEQRDIYANVTLYPSRVFVLEMIKDIALQEFQHTAEHLGRFNFTTIYLPKTDCLRVECIGDLSDKELKVFFSNDSLSNGGPISRIDRVEGNAVLVYFASFKDAEAVYDKSCKDGLQLHGNKLKVFSYFHCLYDNHYNVTEKNIVSQLVGETGWPQRDDFRYKTDPAIAGYFAQEKNSFSELGRKYLNSDVDVVLDKEHIVVRLLDNHPLFMAMDIQQKHKRSCSRFLENFAVQHLQVSVHESDVKDLGIFVSKKGGVTTVVGLKYSVAEIMKKIFLEVDDFTRRCIEEYGVLSGELFKDEKKICWDSGLKVIAFKGNQSENKRNRSRVENLLQKTEAHVFVHDEQLVVEYLCDVHQSNIVPDEIKKLLKKDKASLGINVKGELQIIGRKISLNHANFALKKALHCKCLEFEVIPQEFSTIRGSDVIIEMQKQGLIIYLKEKNKITIAGLKANVSNVENILESTLSHVLLREENWKIGSGHSMFLINVSDSFKQSCNDYSVSCALNESKDGILLKGTENQLKKVRAFHGDFTKAISTCSKTYERYRIYEFFQSNEADPILNCGMQFRTVITYDKKELSSSMQHAMLASVKQNTTVASGPYDHKFKFGSIEVSIVEGDITEQSTYAIVNSVGADFDLTKGIVSNKILQKGGKHLQQLVEQATGQTVRITSAGNLRCRKIVYIVCHSKMSIEERITSVLKTVESKKYSSVSIPAIGTGKLGFSIAEFAKYMRRGFLIFANTPTSSSTSSSPPILRNVNIVVFGKHEHEVCINEMHQLASFDVVSLHFYSDLKEFKQVQKRVEKFITEAYAEKNLTEDVIPYLNEVAFADLIKRISECEVLWNLDKQRTNVITLSGHKAAVKKAVEKVENYIASFSKREAGALDKKWKIVGAAEALESNISVILENLYKKSNRGEETFETGGKAYKVDFVTKTLDGSPIERIRNVVKNVN